MKKSWINNKTILITGASSGIGKELAIKFLTKANCKVIGVGRNEEKFKKLIDTLEVNKENFSYYLYDVSIEKNWIELKNKLKDTPVDIIINNAGILPPFESFEHLTNRLKNNCETENINNNETLFQNEIGKVMNTNYMSAVYGCAYFSEIIEKSTTPAIINISSSSSLCALPGISIYSASKSALKSFTECLSLEKNYYVGLMCPGFTKTDIFRYQSRKTDGKLISMIATTLERMSNKIYKAIIKRKKRCVFGMDAKAMDRMYRLCPKTSMKFFKKILKSSHIDLFKDVF